MTEPAVSPGSPAHNGDSHPGTPESSVRLVHYRMCSSIPDRYPLDASITRVPVMMTQSVSRGCQRALGSTVTPTENRCSTSCVLTCLLPSGPLTGHFPWQRWLGAGRAVGLCLPSWRLAVPAPEGAGRLSCIYTANKEANCSH